MAFELAVPLVSSRTPPAVIVAVPSRVRLAPEKPEKTNWSSLALTASTRLKPWNSRIWRRKESAIFMKGALKFTYWWCGGFLLHMVSSALDFIWKSINRPSFSDARVV
ncbi:uncharacterized protein LOC127779613 [Oryza glaberrima]|uniref:uncharacterized protein LOC127779613 n=1 Tax=Oryza glaberrima TaxID=4538 RepID=UPI00224C6029|nr:uncharacterized protein LOC127779613 [Oryza glaberrima]